MKAETEPDEPDVALLVDWENLKISLRSLKVDANVTALYEASREYGRVVVARAYMDWLEEGMQGDPPALYRAGFEPVYVPKRKLQRNGTESTIVKNSVDVRMAVDAASLCHTNPNIRTFVLVSGDQDFLHVVNALRPYGRKLILVGVTGSLSQQLSEFVDEVLYYDRDIAGPAAPSPLPKPGEMPTIDHVFGAIVDILKKSATPGFGLFSWVGIELRKRYPTYHPRVHGFTTFRRLMEAARDKGIIAGFETVGVQDWAYLKGSEEALRDFLRDQGLTGQS